MENFMFMMISFSTLPHDVIFNILSRIPFKTVLQLQCVCKSWHSLIAHPDFRTLYLRNAPPRWIGMQDIYGVCHDQGLQVYHIFDESFPSQRRKTCLDKVISPPFFRIISACDGLICAYKFPQCCWPEIEDQCTMKLIVYLWNPSIKKHKTIELSLSEHSFDMIFGFGYSTQTNDYKIVVIHQLRSGNSKVYVYSLNANSWSEIESKLDTWKQSVYEGHRGAYLNDACHWVCKIEETYKIMCFDLNDETFRYMDVPPGNLCKSHGTEFSIKTLVYKDMLALWGSYSIKYVQRLRKLWVMKEYGKLESWTCLFSDREPHNIFGTITDGRLLMNDSRPLSGIENYLVAYDIDNRESEEFEATDICEFVRYMDNLALLEQKF